MKIKPIVGSSNEICFEDTKTGRKISGEELHNSVSNFYVDLLPIIAKDNHRIELVEFFMKHKNNPGFYIALMMWMDDSISLSKQDSLILPTIMRTMMGDSDDFIMDSKGTSLADN